MTVFRHAPAIEFAQQTKNKSSVPVICYSASIVTFSCQVRQGFQWWLIVLIYKHLQNKGCFRCIQHQPNREFTLILWQEKSLCAFVKTEFPSYVSISSVNGTITCNCLTEIRRSDSLNSYGIFQPKGPKFLLSWTIAWKKHKAHSNFRNTYQNINSTCNAYCWSLEKTDHKNIK